jgi:hypothetical protein
VSAPKVRNREEYWTLRTARKRYRCESERITPCAGYIEPSQQYVSMELPPDSEVGNTTWWRLRCCLPCAKDCNADLLAQLTATPPQ